MSLLEILVVVATVSILVTLGTAVDFKPLQNPLITETSNLTSFLKHARAKAVSTTSAIMVFPVSQTSVKAVRGISCNTIDVDSPADSQLQLSNGVLITNTEWSSCFTARGLATDNAQIPIAHNGKTKTIEIMLGGGSRIQ